MISSECGQKISNINANQQAFLSGDIVIFGQDQSQQSWYKLVHMVITNTTRTKLENWGKWFQYVTSHIFLPKDSHLQKKCIFLQVSY